MEPGGDDRIGRARVLVIGAGVLGSRVVSYLASAGFRHIVIADEFSVSSSDLESPFFSSDDVGLRYRSDVVAESISGPHEMRATSLRYGARRIDGWGFDVIIGCSGRLEDRLLANSRARQYNVPYVDGIVFGDSGRVQVVRSRGPCLGCSRPVEDCSMEADPKVADCVASMILDIAVSIARRDDSSIPLGITYFYGSEAESVTVPLQISRICPHHSKDIPQQG